MARILGLVLGAALTVCPAVALANQALEQQVLELINEQRAQVGCDPLVMQSQLNAAAQSHANAMAMKNFFGHSGKNGSKFSTRIKAQGYRGRKYAENIAAGYASAEKVVSIWMNSSGHRVNIVNCAYTETGIALAFQEDDAPLPGSDYPMRYYWVQDFARP